MFPHLYYSLLPSTITFPKLERQQQNFALWPAANLLAMMPVFRPRGRALSSISGRVNPIRNQSTAGRVFRLRKPKLMNVLRQYTAYPFFCWCYCCCPLYFATNTNNTHTHTHTWIDDRFHRSGVGKERLSFDLLLMFVRNCARKKGGAVRSTVTGHLAPGGAWKGLGFNFSSRCRVFRVQQHFSLLARYFSNSCQMLYLQHNNFLVLAYVIFNTP